MIEPMTEPKQKRDQQPILEIQGLSLGSLMRSEGEPEELRQSRGAWLYRDVNLSAHQGEIVLLLGASGSGKSLLMNLLIGKISPHAETLYIPNGSIRLCGHELLAERYPDELTAEVGVLFQGLGLLEDLKARENILFAFDHAAEPPTHKDSLSQLEALAEELQLQEQLNKAMSELSGGQRQRVAIARLLASGAKVMVFDEPTSALDPLSASRVVELIGEAHQRSKSQLTLIITHDYEHFFSIADQVWQIQPERSISALHLSDQSREELSAERFKEALKRSAEPSPIELSEGDWARHIAKQRDRALKGALFELPQRVFMALKALSKARRAKWVLRYGLKLFREAVLRGLTFHLTTGLILGAIATYFAFNAKMGSVVIERLPELRESGGAAHQSIEVSSFILPTFFKEMLAGFSVAMFRALIPLFTCICVAARGGTAATAYLSSMRDPTRSEWEALRSFGVSPRLFFSLQLIVTFSLGCMLLSSLSFVSASLGSLLVSLWTNELCDLQLWWGAYSRGLGLSATQSLPDGSFAMLLKTGLSGLAIALISLWYGARPRRGAQDLMGNLAQSNVLSVVMTLIIFFIILVWENAQP